MRANNLNADDNTLIVEGVEFRIISHIGNGLIICMRKSGEDDLVSKFIIAHVDGGSPHYYQRDELKKLKNEIERILDNGWC